MKGKQRATATVGRDLVQAGQTAVDAGEAESFSAWVNDVAAGAEVACTFSRRVQRTPRVLANIES